MRETLIVYLGKEIASQLSRTANPAQS